LKVKEGFMLRQIADTFIVIPLGEKVIEFNGLMTLSESGAMLWEKLENEASIEDLIASVVNEYNVSKEVVEADVKEFISSISKKGLIE
jgi:hypothetical protein